MKNNKLLIYFFILIAIFIVTGCSKKNETNKKELDKSKIIAVYCKSGKRSSIAYQTLKELGYKVKDLGAYDTITLEKE